MLKEKVLTKVLTSTCTSLKIRRYIYSFFWLDNTGCCNAKYYNNYYLHSIPIKGKTTFSGANLRMTLWNASKAEVWCWWLSFSTSQRTLLFMSSFSTSTSPPIQDHGTYYNRQRGNVKNTDIQTNSRLFVLNTRNNSHKPGFNHLLGSLDTLSAWAHLGSTGSSWVWTFWMWINKLFHLATFSGPSVEDMADQ